MYTVGQVAKFLGISRDTLKFYEEKNLINPMQDKENGYRKYNIIDINEIMTVNFYRDIDIEIKKIQEIRNSGSVETIEAILKEKEKNLEEEIAYKQQLLNRVRRIKEDCKSIEESLNKFIIKEMKPIAVTSEIEIKEDVEDTYSEILNKYDYSTRIKKAVNLAGLSRIVYFNKDTVTKERYIFFEKLEKSIEEKEEIISYPKCIYTVIAVPINNEGENVDGNMSGAIIDTAKAMGYESLGIAFVNLLFNGYKDGQNTQYLEIYAPVK